VLWITADDTMARQRMQAYMLVMIQQSGLSDKIAANDEDS
jgi:hypothetical protein